MIGRARRGLVARTIILLTLIGTVIPLAAPVGAYQYASAAFQSFWAQTDADGSQAPVWGPLFSDGVREAYAEAPGGQRLVQYFDKGRMELTNPSTGAVSAGLLASEMIKGFIQTGDAATMPSQPANVPIAGDPDNTFPTYASLTTLTTPPGPGASGPVTRLYNPDGSFGTRQEAASDPAAAHAGTDAQTGHTLPRAFWDFRNAPRHPLSTIGLAITEPVWARVKVSGVLTDVLVQAFERRVLTYTPSNPDPYKVEFGNIGQHYYKWRYAAGSPSTATPTGGTGTSGNAVLPVFQPAVASQFNPGLGNPTSAAGTTVSYALVLMEHGIMLYVNPTRKIYALPSDGAGSVYDDPFANQSVPPDFTDCSKPGPTAGTFIPCRGFGKVWQDNPSVKASLGYAQQAERGITGQTQYFQNGFVFYDQERSRTWMVNTVQFFARYYPVS